MNGFLETWLGFFWIALAVLTLALFVWSLVWVYGDAEERRKSGCLVVALVFFLGWPVSLLAWIVFRPEHRIPR